MNIFFKLLLCTLFSSFFTINVQAASNWTIMIYMDADNNLESDGIDDFLEIATTGSDENINYVIQMDRIDDYSDSYGDWTDCKRYRVEKDMTPTSENALEHLGEVNMADSNTLSAFIHWAMDTYPAQQYALVLWDHGDGWMRKRERKSNIKGICWDDTNGYEDYISMFDLKTVLDSLPTKPVLVGFDACLMGMIENAYMLKKVGVSVMVGSEETEPAAGWPYNLISKELASNPEWQAQQLGEWIVEQYYLSYDMGQTQSAIDLTKLTPFIDSLTSFATKLRSDWQDNMDVIQNEAHTLRLQIENAVIATRNGSAFNDAGGLSIYFPTDYYNPSYDQTDLAKDTQWNKFLIDFIDTMSSSWIDFARNQVLSFDDPDFIDLSHFSQCLETYDPRFFEPKYTVVETSYDFESIETSGTNEMIDDEGYIKIEPPDFLFNYHGEVYHTFFISDNGVISLTDTGWGWGWGWSSNSSIPSNDAFNGSFIAPLWDDYNGAAIFWEIKHNKNHKRLIIQWQDISHFDYETDSNITFQAVLYENGQIYFHYKDTVFNNESIDHGNSATVGVQSSITSGLEYSFNRPLIKSPFALMFIPDDESGCHYSLASNYHNVGSEGETRDVLIITDDNCEWQAFSQVDWVQIISESYGMGPAKIQYQVNENNRLTPRTGKLNIANQQLTIQQDSPCLYDITPLKQTVSAAGGIHHLTITSSLDACPWIIESLDTWIILIESSGAGSGIFSYSVTKNPTMNKRTGRININGTAISIIQDAAEAPDVILLENHTHLKNLSLFLGERSYYKIEIPPSHYSLEITTNGGTGDCDIYASYNTLPTENLYDYFGSDFGNKEMIHVLEPADGTWYIMLHAYERFQSVNLKISYLSFLCEYTLSNTHFQFESKASSASFEVITDDACSWHLSTDNFWIEIVNLENYFQGNTTIDFKILENTSLAKRKGSISVADQIVEIEQEGNQNIEITSLESGVPLPEIDGIGESFRYFKMIVPSCTSDLWVSTSGGTGDCDLYIRYSEIPDLENSEYFSNDSSNDESITIQTPAPGVYYIMLYGYYSYKNVTIQATCFSTQCSTWMADLIQVLRCLAGINNNALDMNNNGHIDIGDAIMIFDVDSR